MSKLLSIRVDEKIWDQIEADAMKQGLTKSAFIRRIYMIWNQYKEDVERRGNHDKY